MNCLTGGTIEREHQGYHEDIGDTKSTLSINCYCHLDRPWGMRGLPNWASEELANDEIRRIVMMMPMMPMMIKVKRYLNWERCCV